MGYFVLPHRFRWAFLLAASCFFYMCFVPIYLLIIGVTIVIDYVAGIWLEKTTRTTRKWILAMSIVSTCLVLFVFKYFDFFSSNVNAFARFFRLDYSVPFLRLILPIGLSFHTFQSLSYVIEVYRGHHKAERHFGIYALYVMFYPQLVAGPIERPGNLLYQFREVHSFRYEDTVEGLKLILWGLFKKVVIADRLAVFVNAPFDRPLEHQGINFILATVFFSFQIYCDFSGYSDVARGTAQVMGFRLMHNFNRPYFSRSVSEFWRRWHISLSTWFKDYVYFPLGGNRRSTFTWYRNILITFLISGFWHGANWTFLAWGLLHAVYIITGNITHSTREKLWHGLGFNHQSLMRRLIQTSITFSLVCFAWVFFRANTIRDGFYIVRHMFDGVGSFLWTVIKNVSHVGSGQHLFAPLLLGQPKSALLLVLLLIGFMECVHLMERHQSFQDLVRRQNPWLRWGIYLTLTLAILNLGEHTKIPFIYFQF